MIVAPPINSIDFIVKMEVSKIPHYDFILTNIPEISIKSYACQQIPRPAQKNFSRISSYLLWFVKQFPAFSTLFFSDQYLKPLCTVWYTTKLLRGRENIYSIVTWQGRSKIECTLDNLDLTDSLTRSTVFFSFDAFRRKYEICLRGCGAPSPLGDEPGASFFHKFVFVTLSFKSRVSK